MHDEQLVVNTPESVDLTLELAGLGSRFLAVALDTLIQVGVLLLLYTAGQMTGWFDNAALAEAADTTWGIALLLMLAWLVFYCYYMVFEIVWRGQTPGKRAVGLRVLDRSGRPASSSSLVVRNLVRLVDSLPVPVSYPAGVISFLVTRLGQRLGDLAAGTIVVRERRLKLSAPGRVPGGPVRLAGQAPPDPAVMAQFAGKLTQPEVDLVRQFLLRRRRMRWQSRRQLAGSLAAYVARRIGYPYNLPGPEPFLEAVVLVHPFGVEF